MAGLVGKISAFLATPQGRRAASEATRRLQAASKDPATRAKIDGVVGQVRRRFSSGPR
ncbi:hypothetical protein [Kineococcus sp. SYSU DK004]|uniref:hypothetical protein n=1 Tax=Kineococcus sp. SYSU DK004 TaxID=3383125 RepID=UPI003D7CA33C